MIGLILEWITRIFINKKNNLVSKSEISRIWHKLWGWKSFNIKRMIRNNFDLKPVILKLFYCSFIIDALLFVFAAVISYIYTSITFLGFIDVPIPADFSDPNWPWIGIVITNVLVIFFMIRLISDYYKLSLRSRWRNSYLKLLLLDILTLNIFSIMGTLIFLKHKRKIFEIKIYSKINLNSQVIKDYSKLIFKIDMFMLLINLTLFFLTFIIGYFIQNDAIKWICFVGFASSMFLFFGWSCFRLINVIIVRKMLSNLLDNQDFYYLLGIIRFLAMAGLGYYIGLLIACSKFDKELEDNILANW